MLHCNSSLKIATILQFPIFFWLILWLIHENSSFMSKRLFKKITYFLNKTQVSPKKNLLSETNLVFVFVDISPQHASIALITEASSPKWHFTFDLIQTLQMFVSVHCYETARKFLHISEILRQVLGDNCVTDGIWKNKFLEQSFETCIFVDFKLIVKKFNNFWF